MTLDEKVQVFAEDLAALWKNWRFQSLKEEIMELKQTSLFIVREKNNFMDFNFTWSILFGNDYFWNFHEAIG